MDIQAITQSCTECGLCRKECGFLKKHGNPGAIAGAHGNRDGGKHDIAFECSLCGLCVESCTFSAIRHSMRYNLAGTSKQAYIIDLKKRLEENKK